MGGCISHMQPAFDASHCINFHAGSRPAPLDAGPTFDSSSPCHLLQWRASPLWRTACLATTAASLPTARCELCRLAGSMRVALLCHAGICKCSAVLRCRQRGFPLLACLPSSCLQTGSGKTYTMLGAGDGSEGCSPAGGREDSSRGLIQRVFEHLVSELRSARLEPEAGRLTDGPTSLTWCTPCPPTLPACLPCCSSAALRRMVENTCWSARSLRSTMR